MSGHHRLRVMVFAALVGPGIGWFPRRLVGSSMSSSPVLYHALLAMLPIVVLVCLTIYSGIRN